MEKGHLLMKGHHVELGHKQEISFCFRCLSLQPTLTAADAEKKSCKTGLCSNQSRLEQVRDSRINISQEDETDRKLDVFERWEKVWRWIGHNNTGNEENKSK